MKNFANMKNIDYYITLINEKVFEYFIKKLDLL